MVRKAGVSAINLRNFLPRHAPSQIGNRILGGVWRVPFAAIKTGEKIIE
jgi:hypothetical protein